MALSDGPRFFVSPLVDPPESTDAEVAAPRGEGDCPMCGYSLEGHSEPRCPECGYTFTWSEFFDATRRPHPFLFEHHPEANLSSYARTAFGAAVAPGAFWRSVHPAMPSNPRRLVLYWEIGALAAFVAFAALLVEPMMQRPVGGAWGGLARAGEIVDGSLRLSALLEGIILLLAWPWLMAAVLALFWQSMRKARVRFTHVMRCTLYSYNDGVWVAAVIGVAALVRWTGLRLTGPLSGYAREEVLILRGSILFLALVTIDTWRLALAYRRYLQFDHAVAVALSSQFILLWALVLFTLGAPNPVRWMYTYVLLRLIS